MSVKPGLRAWEIFLFGPPAAVVAGLLVVAIVFSIFADDPFDKDD